MSQQALRRRAARSTVAAHHAPLSIFTQSALPSVDEFLAA
jgi:hypothetical protein